MDWDKQVRSQRSHLKSLQYLVRDLGVHELMLQQDECDANNLADIMIQYDSFADPLYHCRLLNMPEYPLHIFTVGSKQDGRVGCAY